MKKLLCILTLFCLSLAPLQASSILYQDPVTHSKIIVDENGEKKIQLPDGRIIPFGQSTICAGMTCNKPDAPEAITTTRHRGFLIPLFIGTGVVLCAVLCHGNSTTTISPPLPDVPSVTPQPTPTPVGQTPEPMTLLSLGAGLTAIARIMRKRKG